MFDLLEKETNKFNDIVKKHPRKIPIKDLADFMGMKEENLRTAIEQGKIPGAFHTVGNNGNRAFYIKPIPFIVWYFNINVRG